MKILVAMFLSIHVLYGQVALQKCDQTEIQDLKDSMLTFYSDQLVQGGLFENSQIAKEAAILEWDQEEQNPNKEFFYYHLLSSTSQDRCGYLVYSIEHSIAYLDAMYLEAPYRGQGLGKQILQDLEAVLRAKKLESIKLYVFAHNHRAIDLYKKMGYQIETTYSRDSTPIGHHMKKELFSFTFKSAQKSDAKMIQDWLRQDYIEEGIRGVGLQNTLNGLEKFFRGSKNHKRFAVQYLSIVLGKLNCCSEKDKRGELSLFLKWCGKRTRKILAWGFKEKELLSPHPSTVQIYKDESAAYVKYFLEMACVSQVVLKQQFAEMAICLPLCLACARRYSKHFSIKDILQVTKNSISKIPQVISSNPTEDVREKSKGQHDALSLRISEDFLANSELWPPCSYRTRRVKLSRSIL